MQRYQNIGIGKSFMNLVDKPQFQRDKRAMLHAASKYTALVRFYYGCGFTSIQPAKTEGYMSFVLQGL